MQQEKDKQEAEKLRAAKVELAKLSRDFTKAEDPRDKVAINAEMHKIVDEYPQIKIDNTMFDEAKAAAESEDSRQRNVMQGKAKIYAEAKKKKSIEEKNKFLNELFGPAAKEEDKVKPCDDDHHPDTEKPSAPSQSRINIPSPVILIFIP